MLWLQRHRGLLWFEFQKGDNCYFYVYDSKGISAALQNIQEKEI